ncbi:MAG TPA: hypothetical protein VHE61_23280, partial [Opitutaceae bacterium]|nr:hypothetical protein [Opitutaceae bacterium]
MSASDPVTVLHYVGADDDRGGIISVIRGLSAAGPNPATLGVNEGFIQRRTPPLATLELPRIAGEKISLPTLWRARVVAQSVTDWLAGEESRVFHGHSRAGLLVAYWLRRSGERHVVVSVHCYGRQRWFYRWAARYFGEQIYWLTPEMKRSYG